jgi:hypothetical protein
MPTINQLVRKGRTQIDYQEQVTCFGFLSAEAWRMHSCVYDYSKEAELGPA